MAGWLSWWVGVFFVGAVVGCSSVDQAEADQARTDQAGSPKKVTLLNVSYDVARDFYRDFNPMFVDFYQKEHPDVLVQVNQSHGGSSKQALAIVNGLQADVATMNQGSDIELLQKHGLVAENWRQAFADQAVPFTSTIVFLVRKDNPKSIKDWQDLTQDGVQIVLANPKITGNGRYAFLGAYGYGLHAFGQDEGKTQDFVKKLLNNVKVYENGGRAATTTFMQRQIGDVLITFENEANLAANKFGQGQVQIVYPSYSIKSESPVAVVNQVSDKNGTTQVATDYLNYLWSEPAQQLAADLYLRPSVASVLEKNRDRLPPVQTFQPNEVFGDWQTIMTRFFGDGGEFDRLSKN